MSTAAQWERNTADHIQAIVDALADNDRYLADEIISEIAPYPTGDNIREVEDFHNTLVGRLVEVVDPVTGYVDNPHGPAVVEADGTRKWYRANMLHNASGPAVIKPNGKLAYYYFGTRYKTAAELDEVVESAKRHYKNSKHYRNVAG